MAPTNSRNQFHDWSHTGGWVILIMEILILTIEILIMKKIQIMIMSLARRFN